jgi:hypothetical protein
MDQTPVKVAKRQRHLEAAADSNRDAMNAQLWCLRKDYPFCAVGSNYVFGGANTPLGTVKLLCRFLDCPFDSALKLHFARSTFLERHFPSR